MMEWKKVSTELSDFIDTALVGFDCIRKKMFGCPAYFVNNNMFTGVHGDSLFIRLSEQDRKEILAKFDETMVFEPVEGRQMKEYVVLPESLYSRKESLDEWLKRSYVFATSMVPKEQKKKKAK
jgi:TfoX/Sxy family transcriptional regulator of competence genes